MSSRDTHLYTKLIHGNGDDSHPSGATVAPIFQNTAFTYNTAEELEAVFAGRDAGYVYSRMGNPTLTQFERRVTALEDGLGSIACSSGMAAITSTVLALARSGDEVIAGNSIFGGTYSLLMNTLSRCGIQTRLVEATDIEAYKSAISDRTKLILVETMGNPKLDVPDIKAIAELATARGIVLAVDNTVTTPVLIQPGKLGANIVIHSTSKFINGHGNAIGGIIVDCGNFDWSNRRYDQVATLNKRAGNFAFLALLRNQICRDTGCCLSPFNAFLMSMGIESLGVRMERHCANAMRVATFLSLHAKVKEVRYPGLANHPDHEIAGKQFGGQYGALLTVKLHTKDNCFKFINKLKLAKNLANLGDTKTLVIHPASTFCREMSPEARQAVGVADDLARLSIGLEHADDIIADMAGALAEL